ncbi:TetR family transcriptional regulator [Modestobacter sp. VKM Ac-2984]|uniref:TetR family transcriptional regulator n=1 Tax=Modestobacter sp. VKM Ac-2984 TaxID=3004138 RepID=UPI0022AA8B04|nr:TetR family transcriptional regulator [Modestobacter sp. VKM Ac-2984]MCZ2816313.1 TetR family transcriptional regulator [Modestobacter sp. VKM Ac-2984]
MAAENDDAGIVGVRERKRAHSRATTVDAALTLFAERGYDEVTVADICEAAQIAPRTFFRYFPSREDVLAEPARQMAARLTSAITAAPQQLDDAAALDHALRTLAGYVVDHRERLALFLRVAEESAASRPSPFLQLADRERDVAVRLLARRGALPPVGWRTRLVVARAVATFRVWLDDVVTGELPDPLGHLDEVLAAR